MDWGKIIYIFFALMSLTTAAGFLYYPTVTALFLAVGVNVISTILKIGVRNLLSTELLASSIVADLHLIPAFIVMSFWNNIPLATSLVIGAIIANVFSLFLTLIEASNYKEKDNY